MRLTKNNIAFVKEIYFDNGKMTFAIMPKTNCVSDLRIYRYIDSIEELPVHVQRFMYDSHCEVFEVDERSKSTTYIYR